MGLANDYNMAWPRLRMPCGRLETNLSSLQRCCDTGKNYLV
jgi:hypothetical protein